MNKKALPDTTPHPSFYKTVFLTVFTMIAFAANSILCRLALGVAAIDATSFSAIRLISGALTLSLIVVLMKDKRAIGKSGTWASATMLFLYAVAFSFAYISLSAGTGALILFASVQVTMIAAGLRSGERLHLLQWIGLGLALAGLVYLVSPGLTAPSPIGSLLMTIAGIAWGIYSLRGRGIASPVAVTADNFVRSVPLVIAVTLMFLPKVHVSLPGMMWAVVSGAVASGMGYVIWYAALRGLTATRAATVQLSVPILAAIGGVMFLSENITLRLVIASVATLGGVALAVLTREREPVSAVATDGLKRQS